MRELVETKLVEQTTTKFIADDGTEFESKTECLIYERKHNTEMLKAKVFSVVKEIEIPMLNWVGWYVFAVTPKSEEDIANVFAYFNDEWNSFEDYKKHLELGVTTYVFNDENGYYCFYPKDRDVMKELKDIVTPPKKK